MIDNSSLKGNLPLGADDDPKAPWHNPDSEYYIEEANFLYGKQLIYVKIKDKNSDFEESFVAELEDLKHLTSVK